jgi:hypothetical protein
MDRFTYQNITVSGAEHLSPVLVQKFVSEKLIQSSRGFISGRNIFVYDYAPLETDIVLNFPRVRAAHVSRDTTLGNGLVIALEEREPFAQWCEGSQGTTCYLVDDIGVVFAPAWGVASTTLTTPYVFRGLLSTSTIAVNEKPFGEVFAPGHFAGITTLMTLLTENGVHPLGARLESDADFSVPLQEGYYLKASFGAEPDTLSKNLALILGAEALKGKSQSLEYVDLRFGNRVYYKFKGEPQAE